MKHIIYITLLEELVLEQLTPYLKKNVLLWWLKSFNFQWLVPRKIVCMRLITERGGIYMWMWAQAMPGISDVTNFANGIMYIWSYYAHIFVHLKATP